MILPTKHGSVNRSLIAIGGEVLASLSEPKSLEELYAELKDKGVVSSFEQYYRAVLVAYALGGITLKEGKLARNSVA